MILFFRVFFYLFEMKSCLCLWLEIYILGKINYVNICKAGIVIVGSFRSELLYIVTDRNVGREF